MPLCEHENPDECPNHGRKEVTSTIIISDAMVEAACKAGYADAKRQQPWLFMSNQWEDVPEKEKDLFRSNFRVALEAALNHREG